MEIIRSWRAFAPPVGGTAVAVGNFDGVHLGHQKILRTLRREAERRGLASFALTFSPHPEKFFSPSRILMIQTLEQRLDSLSRLGLDGAVIVPFRRSLAGLSAGAFAREILSDALRARLVVVGAGFRFGRGRRGEVSWLERSGPALGFRVRGVPHLRKSGRIISSSTIRSLLTRGDVEEANALLGRPYEIEGDVVAGEGRGCRLGFPTANLETPNEIVPPGVFLSAVHIRDRIVPAVTNVGVRPTFGRSRRTVESHLLDFRGDLYGAAVRLAFLRKLRDERPFARPDELAAQLGRDVAAARAAGLASGNSLWYI